MKRYLIPQMLHEWRSNLWLAIEIMIVGGVVCYLSFTLTGLLKGLFVPLGFDPEDVYTLSLSVVDPESPEFVSDSNDPDEVILADTKTMISRLRSNPHVEAVAISMNASPFVLNYQGNEFSIKGMPDSVRYTGNLRLASPDIVRVLKLESESGLSEEEMEERMRKGEIFLSYENIKTPLSNDNRIEGGVAGLVGKTLSFPGDSIREFKVGGLVRLIRRTSYEENSLGMMLLPIDESTLRPDRYGYELLLRVKPGEGQRFMDEMNNDPAMRKLRNVVVHDARSLKKVKELTERNDDIEVRLNIAMVAFFLIIVFLGLLGSFWYRVQQRTGEIALRKTVGAKNSDIFRRLMSEGTIILLIGLLPGIALFIVFFNQMLVDQTELVPWSECWIGIAVTYLFMQLIIILGVFFPAKRAIAIEPAIALKDE